MKIMVALREDDMWSWRGMKALVSLRRGWHLLSYGGEAWGKKEGS
jgi:hypothetical protein